VLIHLRFFAILSLTLLITPAYSYDPPPGIPDPVWGTFHPIDAVAPSQPPEWPSAAANNYYYVDNTHSSATDSGNTFGYPNKPRVSLPETVFPAGTYVEIHGGPYTPGGQFIFTANGTEAEPVWIRGGDPANKPIIKSETIPKGSYIVVENLKWDSNKNTLGLRSHRGSTLHHLVIRNSEFAGPGTDVGNSGAISINGKSSSERFSNFVVYQNTIHDFGDDDNASENDYHGVIPSTNVDGVWILANTIFNMAGDSVQVGIANTADKNRVSHIYVGDNVFHDDRENAVDVKEADFVVVSDNLMYNYDVRDSSAGEVVIIHNNAANIWIINNIIHSGVYGVVSTAATNAWVANNVIYNIHNSTGFNANSFFSQGAAVHFRSSAGGMLNNTIFDYDLGVQLATGTNYTMLNNVFINRSEPTGYDVGAGNPDIQNNSNFDFNHFYNEDAVNLTILWGNPYTNLDNLQLTTGKCSSCSSGTDPLVEITDQASLGSTPFNSPLFGAGVSYNVIELQNNFQTAFGVTLNTDRLTNPRLTQTIDIGSFEYPQPTSLPNQPTSLSVTVNN
jgi:hypothetical protein